MKGLFIPEITAEMFKSGCLESIEALMAAGEIYDIEYQRWIPFRSRPMTEEEKEMHPDMDGILDCKLPNDGQAIFVTIEIDGRRWVNYDEYYEDGGSYLDSGYEICTEATAWMPLPEPYKEDDHETD